MIRTKVPGKTYGKTSNTLERYDKKKQITSQAKALARQRGYPTYMTADAGRTLSYYSGTIDQLARRMGSFKGKHFLHLAGGTGVLTKFLQDRKAIAVNLDYDETLLQISKGIRNKASIQADATKKLPFADNSFECLITDHFAFAKYKLIDMMAEHEGSQAILKEATRVLKPNGIFVISAIDPNLQPKEIMAICKKHFKKVEPFAYTAIDYEKNEKFLIPMVILTGPKKS
jgi:ubiquinone/menaquinone biosynthesis C-methylase UbiE